MFTRVLALHFAQAVIRRNLRPCESDRLRLSDLPPLPTSIQSKWCVTNHLGMQNRFCQTNLIPISNTWPRHSPSPAGAGLRFCRTNLIPKSDTNPAAAASPGYTKGAYPHG